jgi:hypothetical protein
MEKQTFIIRTVSVLLAASVLLAGCASTTVIKSDPAGARLYLNSEPVGTTPYTHTDTKIVGTITDVRLEKEGYEPLNTFLSRNEEVDVGAVIGGLIFWVPFLWTMKYKPIHNYELTPYAVPEPSQVPILADPNQPRSKAERLRELKELLDENIITQEEFEKEKQKILEEEDK